MINCMQYVKKQTVCWGIWENKRVEAETRVVRLPVGNRKGHGDGMGI